MCGIAGYSIKENSFGFFFASEIPALLTLSGCDRRIDPDALDLFLSLRYVPHPFCAFEEIRRLPPGHLMEVEKGKVINNAPDDFYRLFEKQGVSNLLSSEIGRDGLKARQLWSLFILAKWMALFKAVLP